VPKVNKIIEHLHSTTYRHVLQTKGVFAIDPSDTIKMSSRAHYAVLLSREQLLIRINNLEAFETGIPMKTPYL